MGKTMPANVYELVGSEYVDRGGYLDNNLKLVGYSTKGGKVRKSARNKWAPEGPYRLYWEDVPPRLYATEERVRGSFGAQNPTWLKRHLTWAGCGRASPFGVIDAYGNTTNRYAVPGPTDGYTTFIRCGNKADDTGFCKRHKSSAVIDGKVTSKNSVASKLLAWLPRIYKKKK